MRVGRPQEFDRDEALAKAMEVFWKRGYEATSVQDLLDGMGIHRGSMYNTFGDKQSLFVEAIEHYCTKLRDEVSAVLRRAGSPLGNVLRIMELWESSVLDDPARGCLVTNTSVELGPHVPEVGDALTYHFSRLERMLRNALDRAVDSGEVAHGTDTRALARFLVGVNQGLMVMGRAGAGRETIEDTVGVARSVLLSSAGGADGVRD
jgi:TetR/AcrR family transcriptional repressor of nem operon